MRGLFQTLGGQRGCTLFEAADLRVHAKVVCHEIRCPNLACGERTCASFQVMNRHDGEFYAETDEIVELHSLEVQSVIHLRIYASMAEKATSYHPDRRACGEVRIPMRKLISQHDGMLYHCWLMLESPGLVDSVASVGLLGSVSDADSFDQALHNGPRQVSQPQACITVCRADDLAPDGSAVWTKDAPRAFCISHWGPLLRSQRQHVLLCAAQQLAQGARQIREENGLAERQFQSLMAQTREQSDELESLRAKLKSRLQLLQDQNTGHQPSLSPRFGGDSQSRIDSPGRCKKLDFEIAREQELGEELRRDADELEDELNKIGEEANAKIMSANVRIVAMRDERNEFADQVEQMTHANRMLRNERDDLASRKAALADEKEALMKVLEDLHQACGAAGLDSTQAINMTLA